MDDLDYKRIQEIEMSATEKLLKYISVEIQDEILLDKLEFYYPDFGEYKHKLAFNVWLSLDYIGKNGKTFVERFLSIKDSRLTSKERSVLEERKNSKVSLFEILDIDGKYLKVLDLLQNNMHVLWEPEFVSVISEGDYIFSRIGNLLGHTTFVGDINFLPEAVKDMFIEEVLMDFNHLRLTFPMLSIGEYLKQYSLNLYKIYTNSVFEAIEMDDDIDSIVYDELDEFEAYLQTGKNNVMVKQHISNLVDFFEYYLADDELTLYDIDKVDLKSFFHLAIEDGFIVSQENLNSYISTLKKYLRFLSNKDYSYKNTYKEILDISRSRFDYISKLKSVKSPFIIDKELSSTVSNYLNEDAISIIMDFDKFLLYILDSPLSLTDKNKYIKKNNLIEINEILESSSYTDKSMPNQKDFPIIDMFYNISIKLGLVSISDDTLTVTQKGTNFLRLRDEDKYSLFFQYIWDDGFISALGNVQNIKLVEKAKKDLINLFSELIEDKNYEISTILSKLSSSPRFFFSYYLYLQSLGIVQYSLYPSYEIKVTPLGKKIYRLLKDRNSKKSKCPVICLDGYKKG